MTGLSGDEQRIARNLDEVVSLCQLAQVTIFKLMASVSFPALLFFEVRHDLMCPHRTPFPSSAVSLGTRSFCRNMILNLFLEIAAVLLLQSVRQ